MGIIMGDGGIGNSWQLVISLNSITDLDYAHYIIKLVKTLFSLEVSIRKRPNQNTLVIVGSSTNLVDFIVEKGMTRGDKNKQNIDIPIWIKGKPEFERAFVKGLVDTDGCIYIHKHTYLGKAYKNIGFCYTSFSKNLIDSVVHVLIENGIKPYLSKAGRVYLYSEHAVVKYLNLFGSSNPRIYNKFIAWRGV